MSVEQREDHMFLGFRTTGQTRARVLRRNLVWMVRAVLFREIESSGLSVNIFEETDLLDVYGLLD